MTFTARNSVRYRYERAGIVYPINWDDMGSSEKDLWEERMLPTVETIEREHSWSVE